MKCLMVAPLLLAMSLTACSSALDQERKVEPSQVTCSDPQVLVDAISTFWRIKENPTSHGIYGAPGAGGNNLLSQMRQSNLAATFNPRGNGVLITVIHSEGTWSLRRSGWLLLDGVLYPIDTDGANAFKRLYNGFPAGVRNRAGISSDLLGAETFGIEGFLTYNQGEVAKYDAFISGATSLCHQPIIWG
jgi:hypothetical protein